VSINVSIPTLDREIWRRTEPGTAPPHQRLRAIRTLVDAGIDVGVGMAPILPGLSDRPELLADVVKAARDAGATGIWTGLLNLRPGTREHFLENLARDWPELVPRYQRLYAGRAYLPAADTEPVRREVAELKDRFAIGDRRRVRLLPVARPEPAEQLDLAALGFGQDVPADAAPRVARSA
jgi:DNA repair photolyase